MTSTPFAQITPDPLLFETFALETVSRISGQVNPRIRTRTLYQQVYGSDRDVGRMLQSLLLHLPRES